jgi:hypothetical protein
MIDVGACMCEERGGNEQHEVLVKLVFSYQFYKASHFQHDRHVMMHLRVLNVLYNQRKRGKGRNEQHEVKLVFSYQFYKASDFELLKT